ncbi:DNA cytosine methyltransferase [Nonomuraea sp. NPDC049655]|uniref:DNA cytosine methyltransferase n=1 Tax=Nonomuraea sp. NPDC049655 TaxID=3364355 RepID=UPI003788DD01
MTLTIGSPCAGVGGLEMAVSMVLDAEPLWFAEKDAGASKVLAHHWPTVPNYGDITTVDWASVEPVDVLAAGFPCQDLSYAGRGAGIRKGTRSGLWFAIADAVGALRPSLVVLENVGALVDRRPGLDVVLASLAELGFDAEWKAGPASDVGACHSRVRVTIAAWPSSSDTCRARLQGHRRRRGPGAGERHPAPGAATAVAPAQFWREYTPAIRRWEHVLGRPAPWPVDEAGNETPAWAEWQMGLPAGHLTDVPGLSRTAALKAAGNGVVPLQIAQALDVLLDRMGSEVAA